MGFKVFSLRLLHTYFENTEQEKRKNISILCFSLSVLRYCCRSDGVDCWLVADLEA